MNGKPEDDAVLDIVEYNIPTFSPEIDDLVREVDSLKGFESQLAALFLEDARRDLQEMRGSGDTSSAQTFLNNLRFILEDERNRLRGQSR